MPPSLRQRRARDRCTRCGTGRPDRAGAGPAWNRCPLGVARARGRAAVWKCIFPQCGRPPSPSMIASTPRKYALEGGPARQVDREVAGLAPRAHAERDVVGADAADLDREVDEQTLAFDELADRAAAPVAMSAPRDRVLHLHEPHEASAAEDVVAPGRRARRPMEAGDEPSARARGSAPDAAGPGPRSARGERCRSRSRSSTSCSRAASGSGRRCGCSSSPCTCRCAGTSSSRRARSRRRCRPTRRGTRPSGLGSSTARSLNSGSHCSVTWVTTPSAPSPTRAQAKISGSSVAEQRTTSPEPVTSSRPTIEAAIDP